ncbi:alpha/beta hydrolase-fold protein [Halomonas huangheensis]
MGLAVSFAASLPDMAQAADVSRLPALGLDAEHASVIGISSGGYMANQMAVAWPSRFNSLGLVASGPWGCARGELILALTQCMSTRLGAPDLEALDERWQAYRAHDLVGNATDRGKLRVFIWHGTEDSIISSDVSDAQFRQWHYWLDSPQQQLKSVENVAEHGWPVAAATADESLTNCTEGGAPWLLACDRNLAREALDWWYPSAAAAVKNADAERGQLISFDQHEFDARGLATTGYLYVPESCETGDCSLVVVLHGCEMGPASDSGTVPDFVRLNGFNQQAEAQQLVVLYPQAASSLANPKGCWDWWGFSESRWQIDPQQDSRDGRQLQALMAMVDRLQSAP